MTLRYSCIWISTIVLFDPLANIVPLLEISWQLEDLHSMVKALLIDNQGFKTRNQRCCLPSLHRSRCLPPAIFLALYFVSFSALRSVRSPYCYVPVLLPASCSLSFSATGRLPPSLHAPGSIRGGQYVWRRMTALSQGTYRVSVTRIGKPLMTSLLRPTSLRPNRNKIA
jgi:hypothetical protein